MVSRNYGKFLIECGRTKKPSGKALTATKELLDYFLRTFPPREEEARGADVLAADERVAPVERTADGRDDERAGEDMRGEA